MNPQPPEPNAPDRGSEATRKMAPVQGYSAGIPWEMHLRAYDVYCKRYSPQQALVEGWCRGGFATSELDMFIPGWREELSVVAKLERELAAANKKLTALEEAARKVVEQFHNEHPMTINSLTMYQVIEDMQRLLPPTGTKCGTA